MTIDDHFRIGSNTKTMTSTVILQQVQEGDIAAIAAPDDAPPS
jgi:D-alanyl-D-alanine carboxypeptidase